MRSVTTLKFESKAVIPTDPRTKLFLTVTVSTIMITGGTVRIHEPGPPVPHGVPDCIPAPFEEMGGRSQVCSYIRHFVCRWN